MKRIISLLLFAGLSAVLFYIPQAAAQVPAPDGKAFRQEGIASWYGAEFAGRPTASGELFNPSELTAAHPTLPFGTMLKITNKHNNTAVTVRVNDRGPFVSARIVDVSRAAAEQLDMISTGTAPVIVEILTGSASALAPSIPAAPQPAAPVQAVSAASVVPVPPAQTAAPAPVVSPGTAVSVQSWPAAPAAIKGAPPETGSNKRYRLQVGSYKIPRNAVDTFEKLKSAGLEPAYERHEEYYRVVLAGVPAEDVPAVAEKLGAAGFREALIREER
ncbi:MAG: septal ring lytic transglycosylase RlpA family protein [Treponema sp.]|jgi:rare lipoprotein A|nr:septal ring lytic transglycosylase RlpA family protein [Treponema sp.]